MECGDPASERAIRAMGRREKKQSRSSLDGGDAARGAHVAPLSGVADEHLGRRLAIDGPGVCW